MKKYRKTLPIISPIRIAIALFCASLLTAVVWLWLGKESEWTIICIGVCSALMTANLFVIIPYGCQYSYDDFFIKISYIGIVFKRISYSEYESVFISNASYNNNYGFGVYGNIPIQYSSKGKDGTIKTAYPFITLGIFALVVGLLIVLSAASVGIIVYNQKNPKVSYPTEGIWFCEELDMQINFDGINDNFAKIGDEYYACLFFANRGASAMSIICQDTDMEGYELGQSVFSGEYVSGDSQSFSVRSKSDSRVYTFTRNDSYISIPATQYLRIDGVIYSMEEINTGFQNTLYNEITHGTNPGKESCCSADYLSGKELTYDLYCAQENRETKSDLDYSNEVYLYAVITSVDAKAVDQDVETHMFAFSIDYEGVKSSLSDEVHSLDDGLSAFLPKDAEIIGSFTMQKIGEGSPS